MPRSLLTALRDAPRYAAAAGMLALVCCRLPVKMLDPYAQTETAAAETVSAGGGGSGPDPALLAMPTEPFRVGPGDIMDIELLGGAEGPQRTFVGPDGKIYFHLLQGLQVWGYTLDETKRALEHGLRKFIQSPQVSLTLREVHSRRVWVMGRVNTPGLYELGQPMTVLEAVSKAGGLFTSRMSGTTEEMADLHHSFLIREGKLIPVNFHRLIREGDTSQNVYLKSEDLIYLPSSMGSQIFVLGSVFQPRAVAFKDQVTLLSALADCRGLAPGAIPGRIAIVRGSLTDPSIAIVDADDILRGKKPDILLQPRDIVYVPSRSTGSLRNYADLIINTFARTISANEGARAGGSDQPVGTNIGISN